MGLERIEKSLKLCWLCGSCFGRGPTDPHNWRELNPDPSPELRCPSYEFFKFRTYTAMDRNSLSTLMYRENYPISDSLKKVIYSCVQCGVCSDICGLVDPVEINLAAREEIFEKSSLLPGHQRLQQTHENSGNPYGRGNQERAKWAAGLGLKDLGQGEKAEDLYFAGCSASLRPILRKSVVAAAQLFQRAGLDFGILGSQEQCCGYIPRMLGDQEGFRQAMEANIEQLNSLGIKRLITSCPGCLQSFRAYPQEKLNFELKHSLEVMDELVADGRLRPDPMAPCDVTYHDPCDLGRGCGVFDPPRNLLQAVPGAELVEMKRHGRWSYCCGSGACVDHILPEMATFNAKDRFQEAEDTGASLLLTACPQCYMSFFKAKGKNREAMRVEDIHVFLAESLRKPEQDG